MSYRKRMLQRLVLPFALPVFQRPSFVTGLHKYSVIKFDEADIDDGVAVRTGGIPNGSEGEGFRVVRFLHPPNPAQADQKFQYMFNRGWGNNISLANSPFYEQKRDGKVVGWGVDAGGCPLFGYLSDFKNNLLICIRRDQVTRTAGGGFSCKLSPRKRLVAKQKRRARQMRTRCVSFAWSMRERPALFLQFSTFTRSPE
eukprot:gb/GEZN01009685.1/.p1 GENE.gb/GEZN01009685.1/~~gb/GEZN01009685.1/.p1  ORF type:complete len:199 (+),score=12.78 gb/GEZN01009685.1/:548-1144(+)